MTKRNNWVSASDVGRASYCPHYLELKNKGAKPSVEAIVARVKGEESHEQLNKDANDRRCYIASHLYGIDDPRANLLRGFRDSCLLEYFLGRAFISIYYLISPTLVSVSRRITLLDIVLRGIVDFLVREIQRRQSK
jgi:hypothetical protein